MMRLSNRKVADSRNSSAIRPATARGEEYRIVKRSMNCPSGETLANAQKTESLNVPVDVNCGEGGRLERSVAVLKTSMDISSGYQQFYVFPHPN